MPDYEKDTKTYEEVIDVIEEKELELILPQVGAVYELGEAAFTVVAPDENGDYGDNANDYSVGILLEHGENRFLFTGDAEEDSERDMLESGLGLSADVFKAAHHGSRTANTEEFLEAVDPEYVVIQLRRGEQLRPSPRGGAEPAAGHGRAGVPHRRGRNHRGLLRRQQHYL